MTSFEGLLGWWPILLMLNALLFLLVGIIFLGNEKRWQRELLDWRGKHGTDPVTDPQNSPARATIGASSVDYQRHADRTNTDDGDSADGGCDGGGGD